MYLLQCTVIICKTEQKLYVFQPSAPDSSTVVTLPILHVIFSASLIIETSGLIAKY